MTSVLAVGRIRAAPVPDQGRLHQALTSAHRSYNAHTPKPCDPSYHLGKTMDARPVPWEFRVSHDHMPLV